VTRRNCSGYVPWSLRSFQIDALLFGKLPDDELRFSLVETGVFYYWFIVCVLLCILRAALDDIPSNI